MENWTDSNNLLSKEKGKNSIIPFPSFITNIGRQQNNNKITSYPSLLVLQTTPNKTEIETKHTHTHTYPLRRRMADPGKDKKRKKKQIENTKLIFER